MPSTRLHTPEVIEPSDRRPSRRDDYRHPVSPPFHQLQQNALASAPAVASLTASAPIRAAKRKRTYLQGPSQVTTDPRWLIRPAQ